MAFPIYGALLCVLIAFPIYGAQSSRKELRDKNKPIEVPTQSHRVDSSRVVQFSWQPRVFLYEGFLSEEECDHLISLARANGSKIKSGDGLENVATNRRLLSSEISLDMDDAVVAKIQEKLSAWTFLPKELSLPIEVSQSESEDPMLKQSYHKKQTVYESEGLMATVVMYLSNVQKGGEILFPDSEELQKWSDCDHLKNNNKLRPIKGNAVLFFSRHLNAAFDNKSSHSRCPVRSGEMWTATKTFYIRPVNRRKPNTQSEDSGCIDEDDNCPHWADIGECQRNPVFMVGSPDYYGTCRKSCNSC